MKINLTKHKSPSKTFSGGEMRFFLNGLEKISDFDAIKTILQFEFNVRVISDRNGIWFRRGEFEYDNKIFILYWDEELGNFFISNVQTDEQNGGLEKLVKEAIPLIENYINERR
jgi:hypothetical protein